VRRLPLAQAVPIAALIAFERRVRRCASGSRSLLPAGGAWRGDGPVERCPWWRQATSSAEGRWGAVFGADCHRVGQCACGAPLLLLAVTRLG